MINELLNNKIQDLIKELSEITGNISEETIEKIEELLKDVEQDISLIRKHDDTEQIVDAVYENSNANISEIKKELNDAKNLLVIKYDMKLGFSDLSPEQEMFVNNFINKVKDFLEEEKKRISENEKSKTLAREKEIYEMILEKISKNQILTNNDIYNLLDIIKEKEYEERMQLYFEIEEYGKNAKKDIDTLENKSEISDNNKPQNKKSASSIDEVIKALESTKTDGKIEKQQEFFKKFSDEILKNMDMTNLIQVMETLHEKEIIDMFRTEDLVIMALYATPESINKAYKDFEEREMLEKGYIYDTVSFWCIWSKDRKNDFINRIKTTTTIIDPPKIEWLKAIAKRASRSELFDIIDFFKNQGIDIEDPNKRTKKAKEATLPQIMNNYKIYNLYGIKAPTPSEFAHFAVQSKCDMLIECGLLSSNLDRPTKNNYANYTPSVLNQPNKGLFMIYQDLYQKKLRGESDSGGLTWDNLFSERSSERILMSSKVKSYLINRNSLNTEEGINKYRKENGLVITGSDNFEYYSEMEKSAKIEEHTNIDINIFEMPFIKHLEMYRDETNDFAYNINNTIISRLKVLRIYQNLQNSVFTEEEIRFFALTYGTNMPKETYQIMKDISMFERGRVK